FTTENGSNAVVLIFERNLQIHGLAAESRISQRPHVNLHNRPKEDDHSGKVRVAGTITEEKETTRLDWPTFELAMGDVVELRVLPDGPGDPPTETRKSSELPSNLLSNVEFAKEVFATVRDFDGRLMKLLEKAEQVEPSSEYQKFRLA